MSNPIIEAITPVGVGFQPTQLYFGDQLGKALVITHYPPRVGIGWLSRIGRMPGVVLSVHTASADPTTLVKQINISVGELGSRLEQGGNALIRQRTEQALMDAQTLLRKIDQEQQQVYYVTVTILILAPTHNDLMRRVNRVQSSAAAQGMRARVLTFAQEQGMRSLAPWAELPPDVPGARNMPAETVAAMYPFSASSLNRGEGIVYGWAGASTGTGDGLVLLDRWQPADGAVNGNMVILGVAGSRKTSSIRTWALREYARGTRFVFIDPHRDYRTLAIELGGAWINTCGSGGKINPLQVWPQVGNGEKDEADTDGTVEGPLADQIQRGMTFLQFYLPSLTDVEVAALESALIDVYAEHGITWHTDPSTVKQWPTLRDLFVHLEKAGNERLTVLLRSAAEGADSTLWEGQTQANADGDLVVLDTRDIRDKRPNVRRAQYYIALTYAWYLVRRGQADGRHTVLVVDEAWLLADPQNPQGLDFLRDISKSIRKFGPQPIGSSCWIIVQNAIDFLNDETKAYGEPVLGNASYKVMFRQESKDLERLSKLYDLTEAEQTLLANAKPGIGLMIAGNQRSQLRVESTSYELRLMGVTTGGDG